MSFSHYYVIIYCLADIKVTVHYSFLSKQLLIIWRRLSPTLPHRRRNLFPDIRNTATFSLPTLTWLIVTAVHGAAWCHLQALPSELDLVPTWLGMSVMRCRRHSSVVIPLGADREVNRLVTVMIIFDSRHSCTVTFLQIGEKKHTLSQCGLARCPLRGHTRFAHSYVFGLITPHSSPAMTGQWRLWHLLRGNGTTCWAPPAGLDDGFRLTVPSIMDRRGWDTCFGDFFLKRTYLY